MIYTIQMKFRGGHTSKTEVINLVVDVVNLIMLSKIGIPRLKSKVQRNLSFVRTLYSFIWRFCGWYLFQFLLGKISMSKNNHQVRRMY